MFKHNTVSIGTMPVTTPIATTASSDSVTSFEQALSSMSLYTATTAATNVSYIYSSGLPLLIPTSSSNAASQSLPTLHYQNLYEPVITSTLSCRDTHEPEVHYWQLAQFMITPMILNSLLPAIFQS